MNNQFSENLKKIRKEHNLSQEQLADELGVSRQAISKWESAVAYPEMDKIIALCDKFNLNIDDLLHKDIKEVKGEEESKKKLNGYIDDFLEFITDTVNMFSSMNFKSKVKCLFEQLIIILILIIAGNLIISMINSLFHTVFSFAPAKVMFPVMNVINSLLGIFLTIVALIILVHIFKTRYLDYYKEVKKENEVEKEEIIDEQKDDSKKETKEEKFSKEDEKVIIRDPKHSEYKFINGLGKIVLLIVKFFLLCFALNIIAVLVCLAIGFVASFLVYNTGSFFIGLLLTILSSAVISVIFLLLILNFVYNRKNDKKKMIWAFILSIVFFGVGCGLISTGALQFDVSENDNNLIKTEVKEHKMNDKLILFAHRDDVKYIEKDINNIKIEYTVNKYCDLKENDEKNELTAYTECTNPTAMARDAIKELNNKKLVNISSDISTIKVYASKDNIKKLKNNRSSYFEKIEKENKWCDERINELEDENNELSEELSELKNKEEKD